MGLAVLTTPVVTIFRSIWRRFAISLVSFRGRFGFDLGSIWDHFGVDLASIWGRFGIILGLVWDASGIHLESIWGRFLDKILSGKAVSGQVAPFVEVGGPAGVGPRGRLRGGCGAGLSAPAPLSEGALR